MHLESDDRLVGGGGRGGHAGIIACGRRIKPVPESQFFGAAELAGDCGTLRYFSSEISK